MSTILAVLVEVTGDDDVMALTRSSVRHAAADLDMDVETVPGAAEDDERRRNRIHITMLGSPLSPGAVAAAAAQTLLSLAQGDPLALLEPGAT